MIPKIIHYCWFGRAPMPDLVLECIDSWHKYMPDWDFKLWNEDNFDLSIIPYTSEAYNARKYAFVSDVARLWALREYGGIYLDTDVKVLKPLDPLLDCRAFAGFEGSKRKPIGTCVLGTEPGGLWITEQCDAYPETKHFIDESGVADMTTNTFFLTENMSRNGFVPNGQYQQYKDLTVFPSEYFSPRQTTGEYYCTENTYCDHLFCGSWADKPKGIKGRILSIFGTRMRVRLIKLKRKIFG